MDAPRINNRFYLRGRLVRDPNFTEAKDGSGRKMFFGRIAVETPYTDRSGDLRTSTRYFNLKVFSDKLAKKAQKDGLNRGSLIEVNGECGPSEVREYTDNETGEAKTAADVSILVEDTEGHTFKIEMLGKTKDAA